MFKRVVLIFLIITLFTSLSSKVSADTQEYSEKQVTVCFDGASMKAKVILDKNENVLVPISWLEYFGLLKCSEEGDYYKFYYPDQEKNDVFAKRIWISKDGTDFDVRYCENNDSWLDELSEYYNWIKISIAALGNKSLSDLKKAWNIKEKNLNDKRSEWNNSYSILNGKFSSHAQVAGELYLPLPELLPFMNAKLAISDNGVICISPNYVSLSQALYGANIGSLIFDADSDIWGADGLSAGALIVDSFLNFRFDRLDFINNSGRITDYEELFKNLLIEDEVFLSLYDRDKTPKDEAIEALADILGDCDTALSFLKNGKKINDYIGITKEVYPEIYSVLFEDFSQSIPVSSSDVVEGVSKIFDYYNTYQNQIEDHRNMLDAVYGYDSYVDSPSQHAAINISALYGEKYLNRMLAATETTLRDYVYRDFYKDVISKVVAPYSISVAVTKFLIPEEFKTVHNTSLLYVMDATAQKSYDVYISRKYSGNFDIDSLEKLRLSAMMALLSSRYAYSTLWDGQHEKIAQIDNILKKLYLSADGVECDSSDYYHSAILKLKSEMHNLVLFEDHMELYPADYLGMKIDELTQLWGKDLTYSDFWVSGAAKPIYYDDNRIDLTFYYIDIEMKGNATGDEIISIISYSPQKDNGFDWIADNIPSIVTYSQLKKLGFDGIMYDEDDIFLDEWGETARLTIEYSSTVFLEFYWFDHNDPNTRPAELVELYLGQVS